MRVLPAVCFVPQMSPDAELGLQHSCVLAIPAAAELCCWQSGAELQWEALSVQKWHATGAVSKRKDISTGTLA